MLLMNTTNPMMQRNPIDGRMNSKVDLSVTVLWFQFSRGQSSFQEGGFMRRKTNGERCLVCVRAGLQNSLFINKKGLSTVNI